MNNQESYAEQRRKFHSDEMEEEEKTQFQQREREIDKCVTKIREFKKDVK